MGIEGIDNLKKDPASVPDKGLAWVLIYPDSPRMRTLAAMWVDDHNLLNAELTFVDVDKNLVPVFEAKVGDTVHIHEADFSPRRLYYNGSLVEDVLVRGFRQQGKMLGMFAKNCYQVMESPL